MGVFRRLIGEPLVQFLVIGAIVFAVYGRGEKPSGASSEMAITVTQPQVDRLAEQFAATWRRPPTDAEVSALVEDWVREEVYYREALAVGLDRDDAVIRRRLRQKMEFLSEGDVAATQIPEAELVAHHAAHPDRFALPAQITFRQVILTDADVPEVALAALAKGVDPRLVGRVGLLPEGMAAANEVAVDSAFGPGFFARIAALPVGEWRGPVMSAFGVHLVEVAAFLPARPQPFDAARAAVEQDLRRERVEAARETQYRALRQRYQVVLPEALQ